MLRVLKYKICRCQYAILNTPLIFIFPLFSLVSFCFCSLQTQFSSDKRNKITVSVVSILRCCCILLGNIVSYEPISINGNPKLGHDFFNIKLVVPFSFKIIDISMLMPHMVSLFQEQITTKHKNNFKYDIKGVFS